MALALLSVTGAASAQLPCIPGFCPQTVAAPQRPPPHTPQLEQATRARYEAEARVKLEAEARQEAESEVHEERRRAWIARGVVPPPLPPPIKLPMVEVFVGARQLIGTLKPSLFQIGVTAGARLRLREPLAFELSTSYGVFDFRDDTIRVTAIQPSVLLMWRNPGLDGYLRSGFEVTIPIRDMPDVPDVFLGAHLGGGFQFHAVRIGRGGFVGGFLEARLHLRGDVGGELVNLPTPHGAIEMVFGPSMGF
ncbi:uncharacterized protein CMC5_057520 [Chondromyces crocatus]|uniref:Outer membrane protein beta-barrel domain-containing protein n=1 Tax=Chondromyces crocatus TaxID=52 RepID=A0A0K1EKZ2_CHOCO|nr:uncharacterized protein CMC5_057520 [Chondromyces crocatus]